MFLDCGKPGQKSCQRKICKHTSASSSQPCCCQAAVLHTAPGCMNAHFQSSFQSWTLDRFTFIRSFRRFLQSKPSIPPETSTQFKMSCQKKGENQSVWLYCFHSPYTFHSINFFFCTIIMVLWLYTAEPMEWCYQRNHNLVHVRLNVVDDMGNLDLKKLPKFWKGQLQQLFTFYSLGHYFS